MPRSSEPSEQQAQHRKKRKIMSMPSSSSKIKSKSKVELVAPELASKAAEKKVNTVKKKIASRVRSESRSPAKQPASPSLSSYSDEDGDFEIDPDECRLREMLDEFEQHESGSIIDPYSAIFIGGANRSMGPKFLSGLSSSDPCVIRKTLEELNDHVTMAFDDFSYSLPISKLIPLIFDHLERSCDNQSKLLSAQIISVLIDENDVIKRLVATGDNTRYLSVIKDQLVRMDYVDLADQCIIILSRLSKDFASNLNSVGLLEAILHVLEFLGMSTQRQCMQICEELLDSENADTGANISKLTQLLVSHSDTIVRSRSSICWRKCIEHLNHRIDIEPLIDFISRPSGDKTITTSIVEGLTMIASKSDTVALQLAVQIVKGRAGNFVGSEAGIELILAILPDIIWNDAPHYIGLDQHRFEVLGRDRICNLADLVKVGDTRQIQAALICALSGAKTSEAVTPLVASYLDEYVIGTQSALLALSCIKIAKSCDTTIGLLRHGIIESVKTIVKTGRKRSGRRRESVGWADIVVAEASSLLESWVYEKFEIPRDPSMMTLFEFTSSGCLDQLVKSQKVNACMHHVVSVIEKEIACMHRRDWKSLPSEELWKQYMENRSFTIMLSLPATTGLQRIILGIDPHMTIGSVEKFVAARIAGKEEDEEDTDEAGSTRSVTPQTLPMDDRKTIITYNGKHFDMNATLLEIVVGDYNPMKSSTRKIPDLPNIGDVLSLTSPCTEDNVDHELLDHIWSSKPHEFVVEYSSSSSSEMVVKKCIDFPTGSIVETMETPSSGTCLSISSNLRLALEALAIRRSSHEPIDLVSRKICEMFSMVLKSSMGTKKFPYYMEIVEMHAPEILNASVKEKLLHAKYFNTTSRSNIRQKIKLNRSEILGSAIAVMNMFAANRMGILEMEFQGEIGTGSGPTNEFYTLVADELKSSSQCLFRRTVDDCLFPAPMDVSDEEYHEFVHRHTAHVGLVNCRDGTINVSGETDSERLLILSRWRLAGQILGRALFDGRLIDLEFSPVFWILVKQIIFQNRVAVTESYMRFIDPVLLNSLDAMMDMSNGDLAELDIDTLPGYSVKLGFDEGSVLSKENAGEYRRRVIDTTLVGGVLKQVHAFATGLESVVGKETIALLTDQDWSSIVTGGARDDNVWSIESLRSALHAQNGYTAESPQICHLIEVLAEFDLKDRELFVKFLTGSKSLPSGGFSSLKPPLTVVKAVRSPDEGPVDMFLPSVMTCANFIKLPEYSTKLILKNQLIKAIHEGQGSFLLS